MLEDKAAQGIGLVRTACTTGVAMLFQSEEPASHLQPMFKDLALKTVNSAPPHGSNLVKVSKKSTCKEVR